MIQKTTDQTIRDRFEQLGSLLRSLEEERTKLAREVDGLLSETLLRGVVIGCLLSPECQAVMDAASTLCHDIAMRHEESIRASGKTSRQLLIEAVRRVEDTRSDLEEEITEPPETITTRWVLDVESERLEQVTGVFRNLVQNRKIPELMAATWTEAMESVPVKADTG